MTDRRRPRPRGYALMMVMTISIVLAIGIGTVFVYLAAAEKNSARQRLNREAYYVCDGVGRIISRTTSDVLADDRFADVDPGTDLEALLMNNVESTHGNRLSRLLGDLQQPYSIDGVDGFQYRDVDASTTFGQVGLGRFAGLNGQRRTFTYDLALRREGGSTCKTTATVDTVRVPLSELALFSTENVRICPSWTALDVQRRARYHVNGDVLVGTTPLPRTTATGDITAGCGASRLTVCGASGLCVQSAGGSAVASAAGSASSLANIVAAVLADGTRGTSQLKYPTSSVRVQSADFADAVGLSSEPERRSNAGTLRYILDPAFIDDDAVARSNRLARLAQIRIIDGVWYINDGTFPGTVVWSDHPGSMTLSNTRPGALEEFRIAGTKVVGRADLFSSSVTPKGYSYGGGTLPTSPRRPVVSYGQLVPTSGGLFRPGVNPSSSDPLLQASKAAKSGFADIHFARADNGDPTGRILPINIDLGALDQALNDAGTNELGARLSAAAAAHPEIPSLGNLDEVIVWVAGTWEGSLKGLRDAGDRPDPAPRFPGCPATADASCDSSVVSDTENAPLPYAMCQIGATGDRDCATSVGRRFNAVRVFNGAAEPSPGRKITIATPLPMYVQGSIDQGSLPDPTGFPGVAPTPTTNTPSIMFAADSVTLLSDQWQDGTSWAGPLPPNIPVVADVADTPFYNATIITGRYVTNSSVTPFGAERAPRFLERWPESAALTSPVIAGSITIGFRSVHTNHLACYGNAADTNCQRSMPWRHFWSEALAAEQEAPPGMPSFALRGVGETIPDSLHLNLPAFLAMIHFF